MGVFFACVFCVCVWKTARGGEVGLSFGIYVMVLRASLEGLQYCCDWSPLDEGVLCFGVVWERRTAEGSLLERFFLERALTTLLPFCLTHSLSPVFLSELFDRSISIHRWIDSQGSVGNSVVCVLLSTQSINQSSQFNSYISSKRTSVVLPNSNPTGGLIPLTRPTVINTFPRFLAGQKQQTNKPWHRIKKKNETNRTEKHRGRCSC